MDASRRLDLDSITFTSPVVSFVTYRLMDAYRVIVAHEQNHFVQANRCHFRNRGAEGDPIAPQ